MQANEMPPPLTRARRAETSARARRPDSARRTLVFSAALSAALVAHALEGAPALAFQGGEDASELPVLINKEAGLAERLQLSAMFSTSLAAKYTEAIGGTLNVQYNFIDMLGVELTGGFYGTSEADVLEEIRVRIDGEDPSVSDLHQMQWLVAANVVFVPIYGRISFASEWNPSFDLYLLAGGGVVGTNRGLDTNMDAVVDASENEVTPQFNFGGGLRIFIVPDVAIRLDVRNYYYLDPDEGEQTRSGGDATDPDDTGEISGFTQALVGQVGVQFNFGGDE
jgi:outer membrane beta-barrel protein